MGLFGRNNDPGSQITAEIEEANRRRLEADKQAAKEANRAAEDQARTRMDNAGVAPNTTTQPIPDIHNGDTAVNTATGRASEANVPTDPTLRQQTPTQGAAPETPQSTEPTPGADQLLTSADQFRGEKRSFFEFNNPKGAFATFEKNLNSALSGGTPEDMMMNMGFAFITFWLELVVNGMEHLRAEQKRLAEEYASRTDAHDRSMGITATHKDLAVWTTLASHPDLAQFANQPMSAELVRAARGVYNRDAQLRSDVAAMLSSMTGREFLSGDLRKAVNHAFELRLTEQNQLAAIRNRGLADAVVKKAAKLSGMEPQLKGIHARVRQHRDEVRRHQQNRSLWDRIRRRRSDRTDTRTMATDRSR